MEQEIERLKQELEELKTKDAINTLSNVVRQELRKSDILVGDDIVSLIVTKDAKTTNDNLKTFINAYNESVNKKVNERLASEMPETRKVSDRIELEEKLSHIKNAEERQKLIKENLHLYQ